MISARTMTRQRSALTLTLTLTLAVSASVSVAIPRVSASDIPCPYEICFCNQQNISCGSHLPVLKPGNFPQTGLFLAQATINSLGVGQLPKGLKVFSCRGCSPLSSIADGTFHDSATTLTSLDISGSHMTTIPKALAELSALKYLRWELSGLTDSGANQFFQDVSKNSQPIGDSLIELRLSNNQLESYPDLRPMKKLEKLTINFNNIIKVSSILTLPSSLKELYLEENSISLIHYGFETLSQLNLLEMISNKITSIDRVSFPSSLATLNLFNNTIETVTSVSFTNGISNLRILNLENNPIKSISATAFSQLTQLEEIHLQHTSLTRLPLALAALPKVHKVFLGEIMKCSSHNCYYTYIGSPKLVCTCEEAAALYSWYKQGAVRFQGKCVGDRDVQSFFIFNVPSCPQLTG